MSALVWDREADRKYETGVDHGALYVAKTGTVPAGESPYEKGVAWNGLTQVQETPSGAEANAQYADNIKYLNLYSAEDFGATIEAFMYPDEFSVCDGSAVLNGVRIGQQSRISFGLAFRSKVGNAVVGDSYGYKLHLIYNAMASPSERAYQTVNDSPEPITFSWEITTTPKGIEDPTGVDTETYKNYKPTALITIDSTDPTVDAEKLSELEDILFGTAQADARLPLPFEVLEMFKPSGSNEEPQG